MPPSSTGAAPPTVPGTTRGSGLSPVFAAPGVRPPGRGLLLVSYHFPPSPATGALRWQKLARYAAERGWWLDVVTLDPSGVRQPDWQRMDELPAGTRVYGVPREPLCIERLGGLVKGLLRRIVPRPATPGSASGGGSEASLDIVPRG